MGEDLSIFRCGFCKGQGMCGYGFQLSGDLGTLLLSDATALDLRWAPIYPNQLGTLT